MKIFHRRTDRDYNRIAYYLRLGNAAIYPGRPIEGNWDTKTTRRTTT